MTELSDAIKRKLPNLGDTKELNESYRRLMQETFNDPEVKQFLLQHHVTKDERNRSAAKLYEFVNEKNKQARQKHGLIPGYIPHLVWNNHLIDVSYQPTAETIAKQEQVAMRKRFNSVAMPKDARNASIYDFDYDGNNRSDVLDAAYEFIHAYLENQNNDHFEPGMYVYGNFGVGKTFLLSGIANELVKKGITTTMVHFPSFIVEMKNAIGDTKGQSLGAKLNAIKKTPVLFLDDIGADDMSAWARDELLGVILEYRMQNRLSTFFSSNFSMDEFEQNHLNVDNKGNQDPIKAKRLMQRIRFLSCEYKLDGINRRLGN